MTLATLNFSADLDRLAAHLTAVQRKQLPFVVAQSLNDAARAARDGLNARMGSIFDRPTPFTRRAVVAPQQLAATKTSWIATVTVRDIQAQYLALEETGGIRTPGMQTRNKARALLGPGAARLNQFGNIPSGLVARMSKQAKELAAMRKANVGRPRAQRTRKRVGIVYIKGGSPQAHGHDGGFFRLSDNTLTRLTGFVGKAAYKPRLHFRQRIEALARPAFWSAFPTRLAAALRA